MLKKIMLAFVLLAVAVASAGTVPGARTYTITLIQAAVVNGTELAPGEYRLKVDATKVTLTKGKQIVDVPATVELAEQKFDTTAIRYTGRTLAEIRVGGTKT